MAVSLAENDSALTTVDGCVCVSGGTCQCSDHCGRVCLCLWYKMSVLCSMWMGVYVSLVEHVSALTTVHGCVKHVSPLISVVGCAVSLVEHVRSLTIVEWVCQTCQCSDNYGWECLCLWQNMTVL